MVAILLIFFCVIAQYHENWKNTFSKGQFQRNLTQSSKYP